MQNNYFDETHPLHPYTHSLPAMPGTFPPANALRAEVAPTASPGFWPCEANGVWVEIEDHRGTSGYIGGEVVEIKELGPLPGNFSNTPPPPTLEEAKAAKLAEVMGAYQAAFAFIDAIYPAAEREGWLLQEAEARAVLADSTAETPILSALIYYRNREETIAELAEKVIENATQWRMIYACLTGQQQFFYKEVSGLTSVEDILTYPVTYSLPEGFGE